MNHGNLDSAILGLRSAVIAIAVLLAGGVSPAAAESDCRYLAVLADGTRTEGEKISGWGSHNGAPQLDETNLADPKRPLRWLCDTTLGAWEPAASSVGFLELIGGDRLPGKIVGLLAGQPNSRNGSTPPILLIEPAVGVSGPNAPNRQPVQVPADMVRRVVWGAESRPRLPPGVLRCRNGRTIPFRRLRWSADSVTLLTAEGVRQTAAAEIAEIHLPETDPWQEYFRRLAILNPSGAARIIRLETADGLIVTGSTDGFLATAQDDANQPANWRHVLQPAWSLEPLWVRFQSIRTRWSFAPHEVPLSQFRPARSVQRSYLGQSWTWRADRNVQGGELHSGGRRFGWGFGVHASCQLHFELPDCAEAFRSRLGLDRIAGDGGCVRAMVYLDDVKGKPLFESGHLIGSGKLADTGLLRIAPRQGEPRRLVLVADAAHRDRPAGADPFDVRDRLDWLEPMLLLAPSKLQAEVQKYLRELIPAWRGWNVSVEGGEPIPIRLHWDESDPYDPRCVAVVAATWAPLVLSTQRRIDQREPWLRMHVRQVLDAAGGNIEVRVDGQPVARMAVEHKWSNCPRLIPLQSFRGQDVRIEVIYDAADAGEQVEWRTLAITEGRTRVDWRPLEVVSARSAAGTPLTLLPDGSILAGQQESRLDTYEIRVETAMPEITALRLEALPEKSLPGGGPGRSFYGNFVLSQFRVARPAPPDEKPIRGRYVRIELPGRGKILNLAEVQVFAGEKNVALSGRASQASTYEEGTPQKAIDGKTGGDRYIDGVALNSPANDPWWEVDLRAVCDIDRIVVWNRTDSGAGDRTTGFNLAVLDEKRSIVWQRKSIADPPAPATEFSRSQFESIPIKSAAADYHDYVAAPSLSLDSTAYGWETAMDMGKPHVAVFTPAEPVDARQSGLIFTLAQAVVDHSLGRFRISATGDPLPVSAESPGVVMLPPAQEGSMSEQAAGELPQTPPVLAAGLAATVLIQVEGRVASAVLVGKDGYVLTAGHLLGGSGKTATVTLADGRKLKAKTAGICRDYDFGAVKILDKFNQAELPGLEISEVDALRRRHRYAAFSFRPEIETAPAEQFAIGAVQFFVGTVAAVGEKTAQADCRRMGVIDGGPLLDRKGRIAGVHTGYGNQGLFQFSRANVARQHWDRLVGGEVWGRWLVGSGPMIGVITRGTNNGGHVIEVFPDSPAAKAGIKQGDVLETVDGTRTNNFTESNEALAGKDPGDEVTIGIRRDQKTFQKKIRLMPRRRSQSGSSQEH